MKPYQKPPMEAAVLPATEMIGRLPMPQRPPMAAMIPGMNRPVPAHHFKNRPQGPPPPGIFPPGSSYPIPAPRSGPIQPSAMVTGGKLPKPTARYHPSLSGSETDVSTSTENLTQVRRIFEKVMHLFWDLEAAFSPKSWWLATVASQM